MNIIRYHKLWPGGNTTAIILDPFLRKDYSYIANKIIKSDSSIEQVGFIETPHFQGTQICLQMMGGEFCGNAARSAAFLWACQRNLQKVLMEVSGFDGFISVNINTDMASLILPPKFLVTTKLVEEGIIVDLRGIRHIITFNSNFRNPRQIIEKYQGDFSAIGFIASKCQNGKIFINPLILVRDTHTLIPETGCASGSVAVAIASYFINGKKETFEIVQPSNEIYGVSLKSVNNEFQKIVLSGNIKYMGQNILALDREVDIYDYSALMNKSFIFSR